MSTSTSPVYAQCAYSMNESGPTASSGTVLSCASRHSRWHAAVKKSDLWQMVSLCTVKGDLVLSGKYCDRVREAWPSNKLVTVCGRRYEERQRT